MQSVKRRKGNPAASRMTTEKFGVVFWNVAGVTASLLSSCRFFSLHCPWSVLCLQEAFTKTEGLLSSSSLYFTDGHQYVAFTPKEVKWGLRAPASIVRDTFAQKLCFNWFGLCC